MPAQTKLILGTINLEETDNAVTAEQAKELLPMFYVLQDLNESDTAAQEEKDGLVNQIQETLTAEQVQAIDDMSLSMRDVFALTQGGSGGSSTSDASSTTGAGGGGMGGPPEMGGGMPRRRPKWWWNARRRYDIHRNNIRKQRYQRQTRHGHQHSIRLVRCRDRTFAKESSTIKPVQKKGYSSEKTPFDVIRIDDCPGRLRQRRDSVINRSNCFGHLYCWHVNARNTSPGANIHLHALACIHGNVNAHPNVGSDIDTADLCTP